MRYSECNTIESRPAGVWKLKLKDSTGERLIRRKLLVVAPSMSLPEVVDMVKVWYPHQMFEVKQVDVGEFNLDSNVPWEQSYSSDCRIVDQDLEVSF